MGALTVTWIGHATVLVEMDGVRVLTDPLLVKRIGHLRRGSGPVDAPALAGIDAVLISHGHRDHLDLRSLRLLAADPRVIAPPGAGELLRCKGFAAVEEVGAGEAVEVGALIVTATPSRHRAARNPFGVESPCLGFKIEGSQRVLFFGDSDLFPEMSELAGGLDLALLPVWGWGPRLGPGHMDPERAATALTLLRPRYAIPIHWGTYHPVLANLIGRDFLRRPGRAFVDRAAALAPGVETVLLPVGGTVTLRARP